ncbi:MAG: hypothetical protein KAI64_00440 [Thermoplasmata archaeon]|nr:hypothetical protein [Thermoplasmata archaeon]
MTDEDYQEVIEEQVEYDELNVIEWFGERVGTLLVENGFANLDTVREASDDALLAISGIGASTLFMIHKVLNEEAGVTDRHATTDSVVKPDSVEAEAVEAEIADIASTDEADIAGSGTIAIRSLWPSPIRVQAPSGLAYLWSGGGDQVNVLATDIEFVLGKNRNVGRACCGDSSERIYFELA